MRPTRTLFLALPLLLGCGGATIILKSPVESKCSAQGLKGCPELVDGVLLYVEGKEDEGKDKLLRGAAQNAPGKVKKFAKAIKELDKIPGTQKYMAPIMKVADILANAKGDPAAKKGGGPADQDDGEGPPAGPVADGAATDGSTVTPSTSPNRVPCGGLAAGFGYCVFVTTGPMVLTQLAVSPGCPSEMIVGVATSSNTMELPRWVARNPHGLGHDRAMVRRGESLFLGVQASADNRCSLTWAGFRPNDGR
jgi:hypothetical protein